MKATITESFEESGEDKVFPLVLLVKMEEDKTSINMRYRIRVEEEKTYHKITGLVDMKMMSTEHCFEDDTAAYYYVDVEGQSIQFVRDYLQEKYPMTKLKGTIKSTYVAELIHEHEYEL